MNKHIVIGNLGKDPELRYMPSSLPVCKVSLATNEFISKNGNRTKHTEWHDLVFFDKKAEILCQYAHAGSKIYAEGPLRKRKWKDDKGVDRLTVEINVTEFEFLDSNDKGAEKMATTNPDKKDDDWNFGEEN